nr:RecName: Full=Intracisternal A-particle Pol-related polyprotein; Contains: RecName: Full=Reverse transcriptase/ribonuclease H; Short=RT; Contains: RecName: Full=Integrase; Short=IN [Mouse intracisternal A-particle MIA14]
WKPRQTGSGFSLAAIGAARPIPWKTGDPVWVPQWHLSSEKLEAVIQLVEEQLKLGHIDPSTSPWNTPIFVIKKKSGKWRLLHDLRPINEQMNLFGPVQRGLPVLSALPRGWNLIIIDIKDCFFSIPLCPRDRPRFAFTIPSINSDEPDNRYQWKVLPQGMSNSPTMCQLYVQEALLPVREQFPSLILLLYMDDILLCHKELTMLQKAYPFLLKTLSQWGLQIATEKVQISDTGQFLGSVVSPDKIVPQKVEIRRDHLHTLNNFQKLLGDINWLRPFLKIPSAELRPLFWYLEGDPHISSPRTLTLAANQALQKVEKALQNAQLQAIEDSQPFSLCVFKTAQLPTAVLWQNGPLLWIHPNVSPAKIIDWYPDAIAQLALKGLKAAITHFGRSPYLLIVPYTAAQVQTLAATSNDWAVLVTSFSGKIDNHYPKHPILQFAQNQSVVFPQITVRNPLKNGIVVYTDGSKTGIGAYVANGKVVSKQYNENSPRMVECLVVLEVLKTFLEPLNIVSDSCYVVNAVNLLEGGWSDKPSSRVANIFQQIQLVLLSRSPVYITHVRAHSGLPTSAPWLSGNDLADKATSGGCSLSSPVEAAQEIFITTFHVTAEHYRSRNSLTRKEARDIVTQCQSCCEFLPVPHVGINPRGIRPLQVWQMDVTHVSSFGKLQYLHVSIDTCSGIMFASPLTGEKASHVIQHCLEAWSAWGKPRLLKTDNGPAYTSQKFQQFCRQMDVTHLTGLPYNPQGQGIVERAHRTLKTYLIKQKRELEEILPQHQESLSMALFTLNFLNIDVHGHTAAERQCSEPDRPNEMVKWKNVLHNKWYGPDPILIRSRGAVCVFHRMKTTHFGYQKDSPEKSRLTKGIPDVPRLW